MYEVNLSKGWNQLSTLIHDLKLAVANRKFKQDGAGLHIGADVNLTIGGIFTSWVQRHEWVQRAIDDGDPEKEAWARQLVRAKRLHITKAGYFSDQLSQEHNILPDEGLNYILDAIFGSSAKIATLYQGPFTNNVTPDYSWTGLWAAAGDTNKATELPADFYDEGARPTAVFGSAVAKSITTPNAALFTISAAAVPSVDVFGSTLNQHSVVGTSVVGKKLIAATTFLIPKQGLGDGDLLNIKYTVTASTS
jgi:hypothetical protein